MINTFIYRKHCPFVKQMRVVITVCFFRMTASFTSLRRKIPDFLAFIKSSLAHPPVVYPATVIRTCLLLKKRPKLTQWGSHSQAVSSACNRVYICILWKNILVTAAYFQRHIQYGLIFPPLYSSKNRRQVNNLGCFLSPAKFCFRNEQKCLMKAE